MSEETSVYKSYLTCQVCCETFKDPVSLGCHHNFCSSCLQQFWDQAKNKNCPTCKRKSSKDIVLTLDYNNSLTPMLEDRELIQLSLGQWGEHMNRSFQNTILLS
ncbi:LOW QUALITY PROTEIN: hypothetical protein CRUP_009486 [Coryphaenoides rupestris]|nr:LOW QUALITY PROTEIN: hypothetical protein CRUP_009486 [Coryphaenoides rupestris]